MAVAGILLAGGESRRFKSNKAFAAFNGLPLYAYSYRILNKMTHKLIIIGKKETTDNMNLSDKDIVSEDDPAYRGMGPLAGIYTAMSSFVSEWYAVLPCDVPLMREEVLTAMCASILEEEGKGNHPSAIIPVIDGKLQPLVGLYHYRTCQIIEQLLSSNKLKMSDLLERVETSLYKEEADNIFSAQTFTNVNTLDIFNDLNLKSID